MKRQGGRTRANKTLTTTGKRTRVNPTVSTGPSLAKPALLLLGLAMGIGAWVWATLPTHAELEALATAPVTRTALMETRIAQAKRIGRKLEPKQQWVELEQIAPELVSAVIASEDARFFMHDGLDFREIHAALRADIEHGRRLRGASTLTQQVVKNLYLSEERSLLRKLEEALLAWRIESTLSKKRILTVYVNIAEWGEGIFGVEAASKRYLGRSAAELELYQAAALVAMLPNPRRLAPDRRPAELHRRALRVLRRMHDEHMITAAQREAAQVSLERWLGRPAAIN